MIETELEQPVASQRAGGLELRLSQLFSVVLLGGIAVHCVRAMRSRLPWMEFMQDDFFYYLKVAQNLAAGHGSTLNGIVPTNGYHPLWFLVLTALSWCTTSPRAILGFLAVSVVVASAATFYCSMRLLRLTGVRELTAFALAAWVTLYSLRLFYYGMEVTLTIPLALAVVCLIQNTGYWRRGVWPSLVVGLTVSAMILSRLDTIILSTLMLGMMLLQPEVRRKIGRPQVIGVALGLLPLVIYVGLNHVMFHTWTPISGMAKQLKVGLAPSIRTWQGLYLYQPGFLAVFLPIPLGLLALPFAWKTLTPIKRALYPAVIVSPLVYYSVLCCLSDWPLWGWYMYALRPGVCVAMVVFAGWRPLARVLENTAVTVVMLLVMAGFLVKTPWRHQEPALYETAVKIQEFSLTHPGVYAMGDRAGRAIYLMKDPVVQTEGLVMDRPFLEMIKTQTPLREVLAKYNVRYYIGTSFRPYAGCFEAAEPIQGGPASPKMRAEFCETPVAVFTSDEAINPVFDLHPEAK